MTRLILAVQALLLVASTAQAQKDERLFATDTPFVFTLRADFRQVFRVRDTVNVPRTPATIRFTDADGGERSIAVEIAPRGHFRIQARNCAFPPLRVQFPKGGLKGTPFAGQKVLKLGTHCRTDREYEQYPMREYLIYRAYNLLGPRSFRARLARATYVDVRDSLKPTVRWALWVESEDELGRRNEAKVRELRGAKFSDVDSAQMATVALFEYLIGNTDWSLYALHNIRLMQATGGTIFPVAYDFDFSGLASTRYATPDPRLPIKRVQDRLYRGPCLAPEQLAPSVAAFQARRVEMLALYDSLPALDRDYVSWAKGYLKDFFGTIGDPKALRAVVRDGCQDQGSV